jgi:hypothetical protein
MNQQEEEERAAYIAFMEEQMDEAYEAWAQRQEEMCTAHVVMGASHDPYEMSCIKDKKFHSDSQFGDKHVGYDPFQGPTYPGEHREYGVWEGSDSTITGDFHRGAKLIQWSSHGPEGQVDRFDEAEYERQLAEHKAEEATT